MDVIDRIMLHADRLTATERKIAEVLAEEPQTIAFGTVAQVARRAGTSGPSVVRLAVKLGYHGFVDLQGDVQSELAHQLGPARERIRQRPPTDVVDLAMVTEADNVTRTLRGIQAETFARLVTMLADQDRQVWILPGEVTFPVGVSLAGQLDQLRPGVTLLSGSEMAVSRQLAGLAEGDALVAIDIRRYERSLVNMLDWAKSRGAATVAVTDSPLSPLVRNTTERFFVTAQGVGPFDSMTGILALANSVVAAVAARLRESAVSRLDTIEGAWIEVQALVGDSGPAGDGPT
ncbi:MAG: MurR/RpiR family transcriptional regulator [Actinomycetota bacterium]|nr:MurR/RpiR family transcriptional regulator [Actinomycetota bacterium]